MLHRIGHPHQEAFLTFYYEVAKKNSYQLEVKRIVYGKKHLHHGRRSTR